MKALITILVLALIGWGIYAMVDGDDTAVIPTNNQEENNTVTPPPVVNPEVVVKEFSVKGKNFSFTPGTLTVNKGEKVRITFTDESGSHDFVVDGYNVRTKVLQTGQSETIEFIADKSGSFEYYCSVGSHRSMGMKGTLIVN